MWGLALLEKLRYQCTRVSWGHIRHLGNGTGPSHGYYGPSTAMRHSINGRAFAASEPYCQCAATCPEYKCSRAYACSGHYFAARDSSTNHNAGTGLSANGQRTNIIPGSAGGASPYAERHYSANGRRADSESEHTLVHTCTLPLHLCQCICLVTCLGPRWSSSPHKLNVSNLLCSVRNWRLESYKLIGELEISI